MSEKLICSFNWQLGENINEKRTWESETLKRVFGEKIKIYLEVSKSIYTLQTQRMLDLILIGRC